MRRLPLLAVVLAALFSAPRSAPAQSGEVVAGAAGLGYVVLSIASMARLLEGSRAAERGDTIRVTLVDSQRHTREVRGALIAAASDSLVVEVDGVPAGLAMRNTRFVEVKRGDELKWAQGWAIGFGSGAAIGGVAGYASGDDTDCDILCFSANEKALFGGIAGGIAGSVIGAAFGSWVRGEHWTSARTLGDSRIALSPVVGRTTGLSARITF